MKRLPDFITFTFLVLLTIHISIVEVDSHASPTFNDLVQEIVINHLQDQGAEMVREWGRTAVKGSPIVAYFRSETPVETENSVTQANPVETAQISSLPENADFDADPGKYIKSPKLLTTCANSGGSSSLLVSWRKMFDFGQKKENDFKNLMCVPPVICGSHVFVSGPDKAQEDIQFCEREVLEANTKEPKKAMGVCCPEESVFPSLNGTQSTFTHLSGVSSHTIKQINPRFNTILSEGTQKAMDIIKKLYLSQEEWKHVGNSALMSTILDNVQPESRDVGDGGLGLVEVTKAIAEKLTGSSTLGKQVPPASVRGTSTAKIFCPLLSEPEVKNNAQSSRPPSPPTIFPTCLQTALKYRSIDGSCNNLKNSNLGQVFEPLIRLTHSVYEDGVFSPRTSSAQPNLGSRDEKRALPSPRKIVSLISLNDGNKQPPSKLTFGFAEHGQFVANDMSQIVSYDLGPDMKIKCCTNEGKHLNSTKDLHPLCLNIDVPVEDPFYSTAGVRCLPFVRSMISSKQCSLGAAQQLSQVTHWMDLSQVYGSLERVSNFLREFRGGRLRSFEYNGNDYLTLDQSCNLATLEGKCAFRTGDTRANQNLYLTMFHTLWRREHNRIAKILALYNPEWSDELLFQEARRITVAEYQHITFNEFLPVVIGPKHAKKFNLFPKFEGFTQYNDSVDASVSNEHTTAAFRMGHSTIPDLLKIISDKKSVSTIDMKDAIEKPLKLIGDGVPDSVIRGMSRMSMGNVDEFASHQIAGQLHKPSSSLVGNDLFSINIQRGRDHGLPGYSPVVTTLSTYCGLSPILNFKDFSSTGMIGREKVKKLEEVYAHFEDVDLFVGGLMEEPVPGGIVGETFACIISDQFSRTKFGDRFHYEHGGLDNSFTKDQLQQIRRASAARIYCDNSKDIKEIQPLAFQKPSNNNPFIDCFNYDVIPKVDLSIWKNALTQPQPFLPKARV